VRVLDADRSRWRPLLDLDYVYGGHLIVGPGNTFLAGNQVDGVVQMSLRGKILRRSDPTNATALARTSDGQIWIPGRGVFGRLGFDGRRITIAAESVPGAQGDGVEMKVDPYSGLWECYAGGLIRKDGLHAVSREDGLLENRCRSFAIDQGGDVWYSYLSVPSFSLIQNPTGSKPSIRHFYSGGGIGLAPSNFFHSDRRGWLWRGTEDGVYIADPEQARNGQWLHLDRQDGLPSTDSNQLSFFEEGDGSVWFGAGATITHLFPSADLVHPTYSPNVFISGFSWNGGPFQIANLVTEIEHGADIMAHLGSLQFDRRNALRLRYRLLPAQKEWQSERNLDIELGKLAWGKHTLEVQARIFTGPWSATVSQSFIVRRPIWLEWPVLLSLALAGGFAAAFTYEWSKQRLQRAQTPLPALADWRLAVLAPDVPDFQGTLLDGRFSVARIIARGGFATVFEGRDVQQEMPCAVKIFRHELAEKSWMGRRFQQEVSALEQIQHVNVVSIYGHGVTSNGAPYLAMELIEGQTLREILQSQKPERGQVANYLRQTGSALKEIHARRICHRDLKPENLMIRNAGEAGRELVLIDFSIAIVQDPDETLHGLSRAAGTLQYMAPEQAIGYADATSDIYSLAKIVLEMLTGQRLVELLPEAALDLPARIRELLAGPAFGLGAEVVDLIAGALEFDPTRRPRRAGDFAARIADELDSRRL